jgi:tetracenomycin A2 monooxygenase-dioxygenase
VSPCEGIAISQDVLETVLRQHLQQRDLVRLHIGWRFTGLTVDEHAGTCTSLIADRGGETRQIRSRFVVGADGWRSDVRTLAGIGVEGRPDLGRMRSVRFSGELSRWLGNPPPAFVRLTGSGAALLATHADGRWVLILPHGRDSEPEEPGAFVAKALAVDASVTVLEDTTWTAAVQQATRFGQGNVLLVGDAAHRVTPAGATGITSGMADAANIAWKLAATLQGWGGPQLVPSYAQEREPRTCACGPTPKTAPRRR